MKRFDEWNQMKKKVEGQKLRNFFHPREIWFARIGENIGSEQGGSGHEFLRPVIVLKKFNKLIFWAIPLTTSKKHGRYFFPVICPERKNSWAILSQIRLIDSKRLKYKIGMLRWKRFLKLKKAISEILLSNDDF